MKNEIKNMDCFEYLKTLNDCCVDCCIIDPQYYKVVSDKWDKQWKTLEEYIDWLEHVCLEIKRVLKPSGSLYVFGDDRLIAYVQVRLDKFFKLLNNMVWFKTNNCSVKSASKQSIYARMTERLLFYEQINGGGRTYNYQEGCYDVIVQPIVHSDENTFHSTTKPVRIIRRLVKSSTNVGDVVLDVFMCSGTTALACVLENRVYLGCEKDKDYFDLSIKRINDYKKRIELLECKAMKE